MQEKKRVKRATAREAGSISGKGALAEDAGRKARQPKQVNWVR